MGVGYPDGTDRAVAWLNAATLYDSMSIRSHGDLWFAFVEQPRAEKTVRGVTRHKGTRTYCRCTNSMTHWSSPEFHLAPLSALDVR